MVTKLKRAVSKRITAKTTKPTNTPRKAEIAPLPSKIRATRPVKSPAVSKSPTLVVATPVEIPAPSGTKQSQLIEMLRSPLGGTIDQMIRLTGWQAHTVRGTISGVLRKRLGLTVVSESHAQRGGRLYRIVESATE